MITCKTCDSNAKNSIEVDSCEECYHANLINKVERDLKRISFMPSCLNFGWGWKTELIFELDGEPKGYHIFSGFQRPDTNTGIIGTGYGRSWSIRLKYTTQELVMTCWMAIEQIIKHELLEAYCVDGERVFHPHKTLDELIFPKFRDIPEWDIKGNEDQKKFIKENINEESI
jgi:hypothetical protein